MCALESNAGGRRLGHRLLRDRGGIRRDATQGHPRSPSVNLIRQQPSGALRLGTYTLVLLSALDSPAIYEGDRR